MELEGKKVGEWMTAAKGLDPTQKKVAAPKKVDANAIRELTSITRELAAEVVDKVEKLRTIQADKNLGDALVHLRSAIASIDSSTV